jgi:hypothetical protein
MLFRAYLFSLPWMAFFAAAAFYPGEVFSGASWRTLVGSTLAAILLFGGLTVAYYGLERSNHIRSGEVDAALYFYRTAPAGSLLMLTAPNFPARLAGNYDGYIEPGHNFDPNLMLFPRFRHRMLGASDVDDVAEVMAGYRTTAYLMLSKSQVAHAELFGLSPHGAIPNLERALLGSSRFRVVYRNQDATLVQLRQPGPSGPGEAP